MDSQKLVKKSKFLSKILRHAPQTVGLTLDKGGWADVGELLRVTDMTLDELDLVVDNNNKKRFEYSEDHKMIRASQGHSVDVDLGYEKQTPPDRLYHGTVAQAVFSIMKTGLAKMKRHHVHLSLDAATALNVGGRRGKPVLLIVDAKQMHLDEFEFFESTNGVWLTEEVPAKYLTIVRENGIKP